MTDARNRLFTLDRLAQPAPVGLTSINPGPKQRIFGYGQSQDRSPWAWPTLSNTPYDGNLMLATLPSGNETESYWCENNNLNPLRAVVGSNLTPEQQVATYPSTTAFRAEVPEISLANILKLSSNRRHGLDSDPSRILVVGNGSVPGSPLAWIKKGHVGGYGEYYGRYLDFQTKVPGEALLMNYIGDEQTYDSGPSVIFYNRAEYKVAMAQFVADVGADSGSGGTPLFMATIPGNLWTRDFDRATTPARDLFVAMALMELAREDVLTVPGPYYHFGKRTDGAYPGHLTNYGSRNMGLKQGQAAARVLVDRLTWEPCSVLQVETAGAEATVHLFVPRPPIQFAITANGVNLPSKGFYGVDASGPIAISNVNVLDGTRIKITWGRTPTGSPMLYYAGKTGYSGDTDGVGNVCDSDDFDPCLKLWGADLTPADMRNWLVPFCAPMTWSRPGAQ